MKVICAALTLQTYWRLSVRKVIGSDASDQEPDTEGFSRILAWASGLGFRSVESWIANENHLSKVMDDDLLGLQTACTENNVSIDYLCCDFIASWFLKQPYFVQKYADRLGEFAEAVGAKTIGTVSPTIPLTVSRPSRIYPGAPPADVRLLPGFSWQKSWNRYVECLRVVANRLGGCSLELAVEPRPREMLSNTDAILRLIEEVSAENLGGILDTSHLQIIREVPSVSVHKLGPKLYEFHASENDGVTSYHWAPGQGELDWPDIVASLRDTKYDGGIFVDVTGVNIEEEALEGKKYVESLLKRRKTLSHAEQI